MFRTVESLLLAYSITIGLLLLVSALFLAHRGLFGWMTAGFWSWIAFLIYFFLNPLSSIWCNIDHYRVYLELGNGLPRGEWIGFVSIVGITIFFLAYTLTSCRPVFWKLGTNGFKFPFLMTISMLIFLLIASFSLVTFRTRSAFISSGLSIVNGQFTGTTTGYEYVGHMLLFMPVAVLLLSRTFLSRFLGLMISTAYILLSFPDPWGRFTIVSMLILVSLSNGIQGKRKWPSSPYVVLLVLIVGVLVLRGHTRLNSRADFQSLLVQLPARIGSILSSDNTAMLPSWFLHSYVKDEITGYDYGIPFVNYALTGFVPSRFLPQKYFLVDWLRSKQPPLLDTRIILRLYGAKTSLLGSFYSNAGIVGVVLEMLILGVLCRKLDGMLSEESPVLVRATGICWMSVLWMIWGSDDYWGFTVICVLGLPSLVFWMLAPKVIHNLRPVPR